MEVEKELQKETSETIISHNLVVSCRRVLSLGVGPPSLSKWEACQIFSS